MLRMPSTAIVKEFEIITMKNQDFLTKKQSTITAFLQLTGVAGIFYFSAEE